MPTYRSRVVSVAARNAPVVFERWWCTARRSSDWASTQMVATDGGRLVLDPLTWTRSAGSSALHPYRSVAGTAYVGRGRPLPVELELAPWSNDESELALRFTGRRMPRPVTVTRYHEFADELLRVLADELDGVCSVLADEAKLRRRDAA